MVEHDFITTEMFETAKEYWLEKLSGQLDELDLPGDFLRTGQYTAANHDTAFTKEQEEKLIAVSKNNDLSLYVILLTVFKILLHRFTGRDDIIVSSPTLSKSSQGYNKCIALRDHVHVPMTFKDLLMSVRQTVVEGYKNQYYPIGKVIKFLNIENRVSLFNVILLLENIHDIEFLSDILENYQNDIIFSVTKNERELTGRVTYNAALFKSEAIEKMFNCYLFILTEVLNNTGIKITDIEIITPREKQRILFDFNNTRAVYPDRAAIHRLFEQRAEKTPGVPALVYRQTSTSYRELDEKARQLAAHLRTRGVKPEALVAIMARGPVNIIVAMLGILKAGACYLPIDLQYPPERIAYMLKDSRADLLVSESHVIGQLAGINFKGQMVAIDDEGIYKGANHKLETVPASTAASLAYVLYTSGSTGKPKAVMVQHGSVIRLVKNTGYIRLTEGQRLLLTGAIVFDITTFEIWGSLLNGLILYLVDENLLWDNEKFAEVIARNKISILHLIPQLFNRLVVERPEIFSGLTYFMVGGDLVRPGYVNQLREKYKNLQILHMYGPTENTTFSTCLAVDREYVGSLPIGRPVDNSFVYIVDKYGKLQPVGAPGEIAVSGRGIARGYLNRPALTAEKFVDNPFVPGEIMYKTGDLGRWLPEGNIQFLGRIDHQVKIRGIRIEPGEIENRLLKHDKIKEAVVTVREDAEPNPGPDEKENKYLCAYIASTVKLTVSQLREHLLKELPDYMVPSYFVTLAEFPLTATGKINRRALPVPVEKDAEGSVEYVAPRNAVEEKLVEVWGQVLGREDIGIEEDFFMIGGDSIKAIQISSRMFKKGYKFNMKDIFRNSTIARLAGVVKKIERTVEQSTVTGTVPLTPVQQEFFEGFPLDLHHNNQAVILSSAEAVEEETAKAIFMKLQEHHDMLRATYKEENGKMVQQVHGPEHPISLQVFDFRGRENAAAALRARADEIQAGMDLQTGPLMKIALFHLDDGDRLLIVIHHLVIDAVSWRILFEDIETLYNLHKKGEPFVLPQKTDSFKAWAEALYEYADSPVFLKEKACWEQLAAVDVPPIEKDFPAGSNNISDTALLSFQLAEQETDLLLTKVNEAFGTDVKDILLTALGLSAKETWGNRRLAVAMEGHGREDIVKDVDINRTVGWFTTVYPVLLDMARENDLARQIKEIKESLRQVPHNGIGYGILKYLTAEENRKGMAFKLNPQIRFNYLGQFDAEIGQMSFGVSQESTGSPVSQKGKREYEVDIDGMVVDKRLSITISYSKKQYKPGTIETLSKQFEVTLSRIIAYCSTRTVKEKTPADLTYKKLSIETLELLQKQYPVEDIYTLTPMQEGMLFHALYEKGAATHFVQMAFRLSGRLDVAIVEKSLNELFKRYDILRGVFVHEGLERPLQLILENRRADFYYEEISKKMTADEKEAYIREFKKKDRERSFDPGKDVLARVAVIQLDKSLYELVWSYHHILMDGWCGEILISEYFEIYNSHLQGRAAQLPEVTPYRRYVQWLEQQDMQVSGDYWEKYLEHYEESATVPRTWAAEQKGAVYKGEDVIFHLLGETTSGLNDLAGRNQVTLNIVMRAIWGIILANYNGTQDTVFGVVTTGRPSEIDGIESMMGLFINTIPARIRFEDKTRFDRLLHQVQEDSVNSDSHQYYPLADIQSKSVLKQNLLDHIMGFINYPAGAEITGRMDKGEKNTKKVTLELTNADNFGQSNYDFNMMIFPEERLTINFRYNGNVYAEDLIKRLGLNFKEVARQVVDNPGIEIGKIEVKKDYYALAPVQESLLARPDGGILTLKLLEGELDREKLDRAFCNVVDRHESLRMSFSRIGNRPVQKVQEELEFSVEYREAGKENMPELIDNFSRPLDPGKAPLLRVKIVKTGAAAYLLMLNSHPVISDAVSHHILLGQVLTLYHGGQLPGLVIQYSDFLAAQKKPVESGTISKQETFWLEQFAGKIPRLDLPTDFTRPVRQNFQGFTGDRVVFETDREFTAELKKAASAAGTSMHILLLAAYNIMLAKYTGQEDIVVGEPVDGRTREEWQGVIGPFANILALRNKPAKDKTVAQFLEEVVENARLAHENQDYRLEQLIDKLGLEAGPDRHPLLDVLFQMHQTNNRETGGNLEPTVKEYRLKQKKVTYDLKLEAVAQEDTLVMTMEYADALYKKNTVEKMTERYLDILKQAAANTEIKLKDILISHRLLKVESKTLKDDGGDFGF